MQTAVFPHASNASLGLACYTFLVVISDQSFIGVMMKETLQQLISVR